LSERKALWLRITVLVEDCAAYDVRSILGQHGLSILAEVGGEEGVKRVLIDVGQTFTVVERNASVLKLLRPLRNLDAITLSHNHYDHTGGLPSMLKWLGRPEGTVPVYAHPQALEESVVIRGGRRFKVGVPATPKELVRRGADLRLVRNPTQVEGVPGTYFLGEVPRVRGPEPRVKDNYLVLKDGGLVPHPLRDDTGVAIVVEGYGAVVIAGCSHSGILNIVEHASRVTGETVRAVVGGLHLLSSPEAAVREVSRGLREAGVEELHVGHCTGFKPLCILSREWGDSLRKIHSGYTASWGGPRSAG